MAHFQAHTLKGTFVPRSTFYDSPFGRMFAKVAPWVPEGQNDAEREAAIRNFAENQMFKPEGADTPDDNPNIPAGYTYLGQFIDHDITFDPTSSLMRQNDPNGLLNFRTPRLDLDNVYGRGPAEQPYL
ncbi:MAG: peroxidase family protein, partial [Geminicoccaceae bacterium]